VITDVLADVRQRPDGPGKDWYLAGATAHGRLAATASEAGVTFAAGTDSQPCGRIANEIGALAAAGVPPHQAIGAASWAARSYLGLGGLAEGALADAVIDDADPPPRSRPARSISRGRATRSAQIPSGLSQPAAAVRVIE